MAIIYSADCRTFSLQTNTTTYQMKIGRLDYLYHLYYGAKLDDCDLSYQIRQYDRGFSGNPYESHEDRTFSLDAQPQEFTTQQQGDFRISSIELVNSDGSYAFEGRVKSWEIKDGKYRLEQLPTSFARESDHVQTLEIVLEDPITKVQVTLLYSVFEEADVITRAAKITNAGTGTIHLKKFMSACVDYLNGRHFDVISFFGHYGQERQVERQHLTHHIHNIQSVRGASSHQQNPFVILCDKETTEDFGDCYAFALLYSGNFLAQVELDQYDQTRFLMGINNQQFDFALNEGESFEAPEMLMVYSENGLTDMSHRYHDFFRTNMNKSKFVNERRPILINTWEAAFFAFDDKKLVEIAKAAQKMGVELLVMDDGWFGKRDNDNSGLGDWYVNTNKIKCGLQELVRQVNDIGMKFGIWFEPEMVSQDSDLYRAHPDWVMEIPNRPAIRSRNQLALDITRRDVQDYLIQSVNSVLDSANIAYMKWDINRSLSDIWSNMLPSDRQGEVFHRYVLGLYRVLDGILNSHPDILFEGCSGGGGRYDAGMLTFFPQYWMSDNTKPLDNLKLHYGTSFLYPVCTMGAHVSDATPHIPLKVKAAVSMCGTFGYELDATHLSDADIAICKEQSELFKKYYPVIFYGDYYRLTDPFQMGNFTAWESVSKDKESALLTVIVTNRTVNGPQEYIKLKGLDPKRKYSVNGELTLSGTALMRAGLPIDRDSADFDALQFYLTAL